MKIKVIIIATMGLLVLACSGVVSAEVLTFDDIHYHSGNGPMHDGYGGLEWSSAFSVFDGGMSTNQNLPAFQTGVVSEFNAAYNSWGDSVSITGDDFNFHGTYLTGAYNTGLYIQVIGLNDGATLFDTTIVTSNDFSPTWFQFDYFGIDELRFIAFGGTPYYIWDETMFIMDNFTYAPVPEPATLLLLGAGLTGIAATRRRRKSRG